MAERHVARGARSFGGALAAFWPGSIIAVFRAVLVTCRWSFDWSYPLTRCSGISMMTLKRAGVMGFRSEALIDEENDPGLATAEVGRLAVCSTSLTLWVCLQACWHSLRLRQFCQNIGLNTGGQKESPDYWLEMQATCGPSATCALRAHSAGR